MKYSKDDWRENVKLGLYDRGSAKDIRKYDHISLWIHEKCRDHVANSVMCYGHENINWEEVFDHVEMKGLNYYSGDPIELYKAVSDGKLTRNNVPDTWGGYHHKVHPNRDYFFMCIKPMELRFTVSTIYD